MKKKEAGFTLIELSIVIVIIGLIVAGVLGGQALVKQAKIKSMMNTLFSLQTAVNAFKLQYDELPGDSMHAYEYWGTDCAQSEEECDGDNNKQINETYRLMDNEGIRAWQHLYLAKILDKKYTGFADAGTNGYAYCDAGINAPAAPFQNVGYQFLYLHYNNSNNIRVGKTLGNLCNKAFLLSSEMYQIDKKYDDGKPKTGLIMGGGREGECFQKNEAIKLENRKYFPKQQNETWGCFFYYKLGI